MRKREKEIKRERERERKREKKRERTVQRLKFYGSSLIIRQTKRN